MESLRETRSPENIIDALRFTAIRLQSRPETKALVAGIEEVRGQLAAAAELLAQAREQRVAASAEIRYLDEVLDSTVMDLAREVAVLTRNDRKDERHRKLFPSAPSELVKPIAGEVQDRFVRSLINRLREDADYASLARYADALQVQQAALSEAVQKREALYVPEAKAEAEMAVARSRAVERHRETYHRMLLLFPSDRALVESFFARNRGRAIVRDEPAEPATEGGSGVPA
jgi:hypothetical protein